MPSAANTREVARSNFAARIRAIRACRIVMEKSPREAPDAFDEDFTTALTHIRANPFSGIMISRQKKIRALWLDRVGYFVYYQQKSDDLFEIIALWHAARGSRPRF